MVYNRDRRCVFVGGTMAEAVVAATWLNGQGIPARTMDMMTLGGLEGLTAFVPGISARGVEVWVEDPEDAADAHRILAEHQAQLADEEARSLELGPITVVCEECGEASEFPADQRGTMQMCPQCPATLDVEPAGADTPGDASQEPAVEPAARTMLDRARERFPNFARLAPFYGLADVLPAASEKDLAILESQLGFPLPESYKFLLSCSRGYRLKDGLVRFGLDHPRLQIFPPFAELNVDDQQRVLDSEGRWPPTTEGMLCIAEFAEKSEGDQVLLDVRLGMEDGEYPVMYYASGEKPPSVRRLTRTFWDFMDGFLEYSEF